jgi:prolyl-tRNA synthetase
MRGRRVAACSCTPWEQFIMEKEIAGIRPRAVSAEQFDHWYVDVLQRAELVDDAPVRGCKVIRPYGYALWEQISARLDARIKATGVENAYFPLFIPASFLAKEAEHVAGFSPEVAWVTRGGDRDLDEPWAVRPTSEAIICASFSRWVQSYRDLPMLINQWGSAVRWEERPRAFLRTVEFLWQEGHTCHTTSAEADERARLMQGIYRDFLAEELAIPVIAGEKTESEKFAGAARTHTVEAMMAGKYWALQAGTSHDLGDHFGRVFDIRYLDRMGETRYAASTSWGMTHRVVGAVAMVHGDEAGLKLPPRVAPVQVTIVPIWRTDAERSEVAAAAERVQGQLNPAFRTRVDWRDDRTPGRKYAEWELKGVPLRIEIGPRDIAADRIVLVRRDTREKQPAGIDRAHEAVEEILAELQERLLVSAQATLAERTVEVDTYSSLRDRVAANAGWSLIHWCGDAGCEAKLKAETKATIRCIPNDARHETGACVICGASSRRRVVAARAY